MVVDVRAMNVLLSSVVFVGLFALGHGHMFPRDRIGQQSYEWTSRTTRRFDIDIGPVLENSMKSEQDLHYVINCSAPVMMHIMKCGVVFLESDSKFQKAHYAFSHKFRQYLLDTYNDECFMSPPEQFFGVQFSSSEIYTCKVIWRLEDKFYHETAKIKTETQVEQTKRLDSYNLAFDPTNKTLATIVHDFEHPVRFFAGKCGLLDPMQMDQELKPRDVARIRRFQDVRCALDNDDSFKLFILTEHPITGVVSFGPRKANLAKKSWSWMSIACGIGAFVGFFICSSCISKCLNSDGVKEEREPVPELAVIGHPV